MFQQSHGAKSNEKTWSEVNYTIETISDFCAGQSKIAIPGSEVSNIITDNRDIHWHGALFVAIKGSRSDGHDFIPQLVKQGVRNFLVTDTKHCEDLAQSANFIVVKDVVAAVQSIAKTPGAFQHSDHWSGGQ